VSAIGKDLVQISPYLTCVPFV